MNDELYGVAATDDVLTDPFLQKRRFSLPVSMGRTGAYVRMPAGSSALQQPSTLGQQQTVLGQQPARLGAVTNPDEGSQIETARLGLQPPALGRRPSDVAPIQAPAQPTAATEYEYLRSHPPQYHGWKRVLDTIANMTPYGQAVEGASGLGSLGYRVRLGRAAQAAKAEQDEAMGRADLEQKQALAEQERAQAWELTHKETTLQQNYADAVQRALKRGVDPSKDPIVKQYADAITSLQKPNADLAPLGNSVPQLNQAMERRWQVLNPGQSLPSEYRLAPNATQKDFDRVDKLLSATEQARGTEAQRQIANEMRQQTQELARQSFQEREEQHGLKWVSWTDPASGRTVAGPLSEAQAAGARNPAEVPTEEVRNITDARNAVHLINKKGASPESMGVLQLIDGLEKDGKLGVAASRWNDFMARGVGAGPGDDPRIIALLDKADLLMTLAMKAHFGASGGRSPQMLQHFIDLANAKKMDSETLRGGVKAVGDYMADRAMIPVKGGTKTKAGANVERPESGEVTATGPNGHKIALRNGRWVDAATGQPIQ